MSKWLLTPSDQTTLNNIGSFAMSPIKELKALKWVNSHYMKTSLFLLIKYNYKKWYWMRSNKYKICKWKTEKNVSGNYSINNYRQCWLHFMRSGKMYHLCCARYKKHCSLKMKCYGLLKSCIKVNQGNFAVFTWQDYTFNLGCHVFS